MECKLKIHSWNELVNGWEIILEEISEYCYAHNLPVSLWHDLYVIIVNKGAFDWDGNWHDTSTIDEAVDFLKKNNPDIIDYWAKKDHM